MGRRDRETCRPVLVVYGHGAVLEAEVFAAPVLLLLLQDSQAAGTVLEGGVRHRRLQLRRVFTWERRGVQHDGRLVCLRLLQGSVQRPRGEFGDDGGQVAGGQVAAVLLGGRGLAKFV